jgi:hypothetical protein
MLSSIQAPAAFSASRTLHASLPVANATAACAACGCSLSLLRNSSLLAQIPANVRKIGDGYLQQDSNLVQWVLSVPYDGVYVLAVSATLLMSSQFLGVCGRKVHTLTCAVCKWVVEHLVLLTGSSWQHSLFTADCYRHHAALYHQRTRHQLQKFR